MCTDPNNCSDNNCADGCNNSNDSFSLGQAHARTYEGHVCCFSHLPKADLLTFWFSHFGPCLVKVPKGEPLFPGPLGK